MDLQILSTAFSAGESIPVQYTCDGSNVSPPLRWGPIPNNTHSLALICEDPDAPSGLFTHWLIYNLPPLVSDLPESLPASATLEETGASQGRNDFGKIGYGGPCPPLRDNAHRYFFRLYALDTVLRLQAGADRDEFLRAIEGHTLSQGELMGTYQRRQAQTKGA